MSDLRKRVSKVTLDKWQKHVTLIGDHYSVALNAVTKLHTTIFSMDHGNLIMNKRFQKIIQSKEAVAYHVVKAHGGLRRLQVALERLKKKLEA